MSTSCTTFALNRYLKLFSLDHAHRARKNWTYIGRKWRIYSAVITLCLDIYIAFGEIKSMQRKTTEHVQVTIPFPLKLFARYSTILHANPNKLIVQYMMHHSKCRLYHVNYVQLRRNSESRIFLHHFTKTHTVFVQPVGLPLEIYKTTDLNASKIPAIMYWLVLNFEDIHSTCVSVMCRCHSVLWIYIYFVQYMPLPAFTSLPFGKTQISIDDLG